MTHEAHGWHLSLTCHVIGRGPVKYGAGAMSDEVALTDFGDLKNLQLRESLTSPHIEELRWNVSAPALIYI